MNRVAGVFTVELALVLVLLSSFFALQVNYMIAVAKKGAMDRAAYSAATLMAERRQFFDDEGYICGVNGSDATKCNKLMGEIRDVVTGAMARALSSFDPNDLAIVVEEYIPAPPAAAYTVRSLGDGSGCDLVSINNSAMDSLSPLTSKSRRLPIYQVSLCYKTEFNLLGAIDGNPFNIVASSISFARF
ncbi:pilus assembly protein TadF [Ferrimonas sediminicola]|uniref:Pilus assembly protein TadF n=1 Tax=Ferrimonas sediminicola TaxID=2569538 RepID=A0A4V5NV30_9GAMM|nr:tight adherence pilus pseudopilin TadF [Ferrimonas sediminicola]TKB48924.1 pilus assembly protein TadF [Ferrimonas sediminicola]